MLSVDGRERSVSEDEARLLVAELYARTPLSPHAYQLALRIDREVTSQFHGRTIELDAGDQLELRLILQALELEGRLTDRLRSLQMALIGERWAGE